MRLADSGVARVVPDVLVTAEGIGFGKSWRAARHMGERLFVAEPAEEIVVFRKLVVQPAIELGFIQFTHRLIDIVVARAGVVGVRRGVNVHHGLTDTVDQAGWNLVAGSALRLASIGIGLKIGFPELSHWK